MSIISYKFLRIITVVASILHPLNGVSIPNKNSTHEIPVDGDNGNGVVLNMDGLPLKLVAIFALVLLGGIFSGLTIGLMGLDVTKLQVQMVAGKPQEKKYARKVLTLFQYGKHWVLVALLLANVIVNETLPIIFDTVLSGGWPAVLISTALIVVFGEIIPQAVGVRYGLAIGANFSWFVILLMYLLSPVARPIAGILDLWLGEQHGTKYRKSELKTLVSLHRSGGMESLNEDEIQIVGSVLDLREKPVSAVMTPLEDVFTLRADEVLDQKNVDKILSKGYSRIPVYDPPNQTNFIGMLLVKRLITYDPANAWSVRDFQLSPLPETCPFTSCLDILKYFQEGRSHMVLVSEEPGGDGDALGILTLEDVIEELIGEEIVDETDVYVDVHHKIEVTRLPPRQTIRRSYHSFLRSNNNNLDKLTSESANNLNKLTSENANGSIKMSDFKGKSNENNESESANGSINMSAYEGRSNENINNNTHNKGKLNDIHDDSTDDESENEVMPKSTKSFTNNDSMNNSDNEHELVDLTNGINTPKK